MCGIAGIVSFDGRPISGPELERINTALTHRGPDGSGLHLDGSVGLAHRRLAIIDPALGVQPFLSEDRQLALTFNGEIYNYVEIREELRSDFTFKTTSDTEVLLRAYEKWGIDCLKKLRGMFAFALLDRRRARLFLVRDRVGIKPLYLWRTNERLVFASELAALAKAEGFPKQIASDAVASYFRLQYVPAPRTIYQGVEKLEPASYLELDLETGQGTRHRYWDLVLEPSHRPEGELLEELNALLDETVRIYVRSDVPFGAFLSGGVDSSLVTALMSKHLAHPVRTFSIGFSEEAHSELPYAAEASRVIGTSHHEKVVSPDLASGILEKLARHYGEPFGDSSAVPTYYVSREAASEVKMVLSGDGGDELFGGYNSYQAVLRELAKDPLGLLSALRLLGFERLERLPAPAAIIRRLAGLGAGVVDGAPEPVRRLIRALKTKGLRSLHDAHREAFDEEGLRAFLRPGLALDDPAPLAGVSVRAGVDPLTWFQAHDFKTYLVDDVLTKVDRASMASSLEVRVPLLDHRVVEYAFRLPLGMKLRAGPGDTIKTKVLLKESAERFFTPAFLDRPKQGFGIPNVEWCKGPLRPMIEEHLRDRQSGVFDWIRFEAVQGLLDALFRGNDAQVARVWYALMFALWFRHVHRA